MERKLYPCKECGRKVPIRSKGLCPACRHKQKQAELTNKPRISRKPLKRGYKKRDSCVDEYFSLHISLLEKNPKSELNGNVIYEPSKVNICHIFPKRRYKSVQCNLDNCVYLTWSQHTRFDELLDKLEFDKLKVEFAPVWGIIQERVIKLLPVIMENGKLLDKFKEELNIE